jgi:hypothetical protein
MLGLRSKSALRPELQKFTVAKARVVAHKCSRVRHEGAWIIGLSLGLRVPVEVPEVLSAIRKKSETGFTSALALINSTAVKPEEITRPLLRKTAPSPLPLHVF